MSTARSVIFIRMIRRLTACGKMAVIPAVDYKVEAFQCPITLFGLPLLPT